MNKITVGILTISDRCSRNQAKDTSGLNLIEMIKNGILNNALVSSYKIVPDDKSEIEKNLKEWCDQLNLKVILTTGGTGIAPTDITPETTEGLLDKKIPGISNLIFKYSSEVTPFAALSRGVAGIRKNSLIINFPGSKKASEECLKSIAEIIPHAVNLICENKVNVEAVHSALQSKKSKVNFFKVSQRPRKSEYRCVEVKEAQEIILNLVNALRQKEVVDYASALNLVLAQDVRARDYLPPCDVSLKDGYAVLSSDTQPQRCVIGCSSAGNQPSFEGELPSGCCIRINTGAPILAGADAVVEVEETFLVEEVEGSEEATIKLQSLPTKGQNVRPKGHDFQKGELLLKSGTYLDSGAIGLLAAAGCTSVEVFKKPTVAIFSTGDELVEPAIQPPLGKVRDSNTITLLSILKEEGFSGLNLGIIPDDPDALLNALEKGFRAADIVVTTGSMSMGDKDYLKNVLVEDFQANICFGRVFVKPGKPTAFATVTFGNKEKFWFGLPGNPASATVTAHLLLLPALRQISAQPNVLPPGFPVELKDKIVLEDRPLYVRAVLNMNPSKRRWEASKTGNQSSSRIASCVNADCLLEIPDETKVAAETFEPGSIVNALIINKNFYTNIKLTDEFSSESNFQY